MRRAKVFVHNTHAGILEERDLGSKYVFCYEDGYDGESVSLTLPVRQREYHFVRFPSFFEGLLPEGEMLEALLLQNKIDREDLFSQLMAVGQETVGAVTVIEVVD